LKRGTTHRNRKAACSPLIAPRCVPASSFAGPLKAKLVASSY